ncbi:MAG: alanine racemase [Acidimicrobiales bacterium]
MEVAAAAGVREVLIDVDVGMPRCGCRPEEAGPLAELARSQGLSVRGVMGYEGHLMAEPTDRAAKVAAAMSTSSPPTPRSAATWSRAAAPERGTATST